MRFCLLASGSNGNACYVEAGGARLLIDLGIGPKVLMWRLQTLGVRRESLTHLLLTHEHTDHVSGVDKLLKYAPGLVIHATPGTAAALSEQAQRHVEPVRPGQRFAASGFEVLPLATSHDAAEPTAYRLEAGGVSLGYATDLGVWDRALEDGLQGLDALVLESNHCPDLLARGPYPAWLKARVAGDQGHLSNGQCRTLLERLLHPGLRHVALAHLSAENNRPDQAVATVSEIFGGPDAPRPIDLTVGSRKEPLAPVDLKERTPSRRRCGAQTSLPL